MNNYYPSQNQIEHLFAFLNDSKNYLITSNDIQNFINTFAQADETITACFYSHNIGRLNFRAKFPRIIYVLSGKITASYANQVQIIEAGNLIFANEDTFIAFENHSTDTKLVNIYLKQDFINENASFFAHSNGQIANYILANFGLLNAQTKPLFLKIPTKSDAHFSILFLAKFILAQQKEIIFPIFLWMINNLNHYLPELPKEDLSARILQLIDRELTSISLEALAKQLGYSPSYTSKMIRKHFSTSFQNIVMDKKIVRAQWLLTHSDESILTISETIGFSDKSYFYKLFKQKVQLTPNQYRKLHLDA